MFMKTMPDVPESFARNAAPAVRLGSFEKLSLSARAMA
jgi:hypothetical protein